jgi:hypothetical protein
MSNDLRRIAGLGPGWPGRGLRLLQTSLLLLEMGSWHRLGDQGAQGYTDGLAWQLGWPGLDRNEGGGEGARCLQRLLLERWGLDGRPHGLRWGRRVHPGICWRQPA